MSKEEVLTCGSQYVIMVVNRKTYISLASKARGNKDTEAETKTPSTSTP